MELFSLGLVNFQNPGQPNYTETDIREAAKAFTGYRIQNGQSTFIASQHNDGPKTVMGQTGNWRAPDIARICLEQPAAPFFIGEEAVQVPHQRYTRTDNGAADAAGHAVPPEQLEFRRDG